MDEWLPLAQRMALKHMGPIGNHLVDIHVGLCARSSLPDNQWKLINKPPRENLITHLGNQVSLFDGQYTRIRVGICRSLLEVSKSRYNLARHGCRGSNFEIVAGAFR